MVYKTSSNTFYKHPINREWENYNKFTAEQILFENLYQGDLFNKFLMTHFGLHFNFETFDRIKTLHGFDMETYTYEFDILNSEKFLLAKLKYGL